MKNEPYGWVKNGEYVLYIEKPDSVFNYIPLYTHPLKEPNYKFGVDWSKDGNAVTVLKICEDGVAEVVFMDYQKATHPVKEQDESFDRTASHMAGEYVSYKAELTDEEIISEWVGCERNYYNFAKAILRKAQKK